MFYVHVKPFKSPAPCRRLINKLVFLCKGKPFRHYQKKGLQPPLKGGKIPCSDNGGTIA